MNILYVFHYAGSPVHGMSYRPYYMAREWIRQGHNVTIVAASQSHLRSVQPSCPESMTTEILDGIRYLWLRTPPYQGNGLGRVKNMLAFVSRLWRLAPRLARELKPDLVIASSTYPLDIYPSRRIAKVAGARLVFEVHDLWTLSPMELGNMSKWHPFIMVMQQAENYAYRMADKVISMLPKAQEHMCLHGMAPHKFAHVPNGIDVSEWGGTAVPVPDTHNKALNQLKQQQRFIVGYAGAHGVANALDSLLDAALLLREVPVDLVLVGQGPEKERLQQKASDCNLTNVHFLPPVPKEAIPALLVSMDALYIGLQKQPLFRFGISPNKLMDYMMSGKPVVHAIEAGNDMVADSGCGISVEPESPNAIAAAIRQLQSLTAEERREMGQRGQDYVVCHHDYQVLAKNFLDNVA